MTGLHIVCPECDGAKSYTNIDGVLVMCEQCQGKGWVDEDELEEDEEEEEDE